MNREYWESEIGRFAWKKHLELNARRRAEQIAVALAPRPNVTAIAPGAECTEPALGKIPAPGDE